MIPRVAHLKALQRLVARYPVVGIIGPRQVGKTTLARAFARRWGNPTSFFDLENPEDLARLQDPMVALKSLKGLVVLDEVQRLTELFAVLRVLVDRPNRSVHFMVLGSASPQLLRQSSESLAGRIAYHELAGFSLEEVGAAEGERLWFRGTFPRSYLVRTHAESDEWRRQFIQTFLERDLPPLGIKV